MAQVATLDGEGLRRGRTVSDIRGDSIGGERHVEAPSLDRERLAEGKTNSAQDGKATRTPREAARRRRGIC